MGQQPDSEESAAKPAAMGKFEEACEKAREGDLQRAGEICAGIINIEPDHPDAWYLLGVVMLDTGNADVATGLLNQAVELLPGQPHYHVNLGLAHLRMGNLVEAQASFDHAETLDSEAIAAVGKGLMEIGRVRAIRAGDERTSVRPLNFVLDPETRFESEVTPESLAAWKESDIYRRELEYFRSYPEKSLLCATSRLFIYHCVRVVKPKRVIEIGTYHAGTAEVIARALWENGAGILHTTDPFGANRCPEIIAPWPTDLQRHIKYYPLDSMNFFMDLCSEPEKSIDIAFIDGNHDFEFAYYDLLMSAKAVKPGGMIIMDNIEQSGPYFAAREFLLNHPDWEEVGIPCARNFDHSDPFGIRGARASIQDSSFLILKSPKWASVHGAPYSTGQVRSSIRKIDGVSLACHVDEAQQENRGTLHIELILRIFYNDGRFPMEIKKYREILASQQETIIIGFEDSINSEEVGTHTVEINLYWETPTTAPLRIRELAIFNAKESERLLG